jgi:replicative DNA helicase
LKLDETTQGRVPPQAVDVETQVLGAALIDKEAVPKLMEILQPDSFYKTAHQKIFKGIITLFERNEPVDTVTLTEELRRSGTLDEIGGPLYLTDLTIKVTSAANVEYHAHIILEKALMRHLITATSEITSRAYSETEDAIDLLDEAETKIFQISEHRLKRSSISIKKALMDTMEILEKIHGKHGGVTGVPSGFVDLDKETGGFQNSDLIIIAGRPSQGKTALALTIARNAALHPAKPTPVAIFSIEMAEHQLATRMLSSEAKINAHALRTGRLPEEQWSRLSKVAGRLAEAKIYIDDSPSLSILEIRAKTRRMKAEYDVGMVIVDYMQLIHTPKSLESREREISMISRSLKALAKELNIPVIALSQLNRGLETRSGDKRPVLADLRESGAIEQDADVVLFVHRPEMFKIESLRDDDGNTISTEGLAEIIIGKQRNGPTGIVRLTFRKEYAGFENYKSESFEQYMPVTVPEIEPPF